jgi:DNA-binding IclR family transcriptional regulator
MVRTLGWALDDEEHESGIRCIAAPIYDFTGKIIAALSILETRPPWPLNAMRKTAGVSWIPRGKYPGAWGM